MSIDDAKFMEITPLLRAIYLNRPKIVKYLLDINSDINLASKEGKNAISFTNSAETKEILLQHIADQKLHQEEQVILEPIIEKIKPNGDCMYQAIINGYSHIYPDIEIGLNVLREGVSYLLQNNSDLIVTQLLNNIITQDLSGLPEEISSRLSELIQLRQQGIEDANIADLISIYGLPEMYRNAITINGVWGDNIELGAISEILNIIIVINNTNGTRTIVDNTNEENPQTIELLYSGNHYDLIVGFRERLNDASEALSEKQVNEEKIENSEEISNRSSNIVLSIPEIQQETQPKELNYIFPIVSSAIVFIGYYILFLGDECSSI